MNPTDDETREQPPSTEQSTPKRPGFGARCPLCGETARLAGKKGFFVGYWCRSCGREFQLMDPAAADSLPLFRRAETGDQ